MTLAIMQPYFFPYIGYFQLIHAADRFVLADEVQYIRHGWVNRNRILSREKEWEYITIPVAKHHFKSNISEIKIAADQPWEREILKKIVVYKKAPYFKDTLELVQQCFSLQTKNISDLNKNCLEIVFRYLGMEKKIELQSQLSIDYSQVQNKTDRVLALCQQLGATNYLNPIGGKELYNKAEFKNRGIYLQFLQSETKSYQQFSKVFEPNLSIIDELMFNDKETIKGKLHHFQLV